MYLETYALLSPNDLSGPSGFVPEDVTFPLLSLPAPFPVMGLLFSLTCKEGQVLLVTRSIGLYINFKMYIPASEIILLRIS